MCSELCCELIMKVETNIGLLMLVIDWLFMRLDDVRCKGTMG